MSPSQFAKEKLDLNCWSKMDEIFEAVAPSDGSPGHRKILVRSCNGAGKTTALAAICNWYFSTYKDSIVLTTASSWMQVKRNLWGEIRRQAREAKLYKGKNVVRTDTMIKVTDKHFMLGISPKIPENAMGFHAPHMLVAVDEATGVDREIITALTGNLTGANSQIVLICNPIDKDSYAYEAEKSGGWKVIKISAFDHPNVIDNNENIAGAVTREWIADRIKAWSHEVRGNLAEVGRQVYVKWLDKWYQNTAIVQARILGVWAQLDNTGLIPLELIQRCTGTSRLAIGGVRLGTSAKQLTQLINPPYSGTAEPRLMKTRTMGVDISRGNSEDNTVYAFFDIYDGAPDVQLPFQKYPQEDLMATAARIQREYLRCQTEGIHLVIAIDDTGLGGGVTDKLKLEGIPVHSVNFCHKPKGFLPGKDIANARAEMYFVLKEEIQDGSIVLTNDNNFHQELSSVKLDISKINGAFKLEDKSAIRERLGRSPDYADATALARYALRLQAMNKRDWSMLMGV